MSITNDQKFFSRLCYEGLTYRLKQHPVWDVDDFVHGHGPADASRDEQEGLTGRVPIGRDEAAEQKK